MNNNEMITKLGMAKLVLTSSYKRGDFHQAILDVAYADWQDESAGVKSYGDMIDNARKQYGELFFAAILVGKYNHQVGNGGHRQYFDNGYCDRDGGGFGSEHDPEIPLHKEMIEVLEYTLAPLAIKGFQVEVMAKAKSIMERFEIWLDDEKVETCTCEECCGSGTVDDPDDEDGDQIDCPGCDGSGEVECDNEEYGSITNTLLLDQLDTEWYKVDNAFMTTVNHIIAVQLGIHSKDVAPIFAAAAKFETELAAAKADPNYVMPNGISAVLMLGNAAVECYDLLADDNIRYHCLEAVKSGDAITGYADNKESRARVLLDRKLHRMEIDAVITNEEIEAEFNPLGRPGISEVCARCIGYQIQYEKFVEIDGKYKKVKK